MSYTKHTWETGEVIEATQLNNLEDGVADNESKINSFFNGYDITIIGDSGFTNGLPNTENQASLNYSNGVLISNENNESVQLNIDGLVFTNSEGNDEYLDYDRLVALIGLINN